MVNWQNYEIQEHLNYWPKLETMDKLKIEKIGTLKSEILAEFKTPETVSLYRDLPKCQKLQKILKYHKLILAYQIPDTRYQIPDTRYKNTVTFFCNALIYRKLENWSLKKI